MHKHRESTFITFVDLLTGVVLILLLTVVVFVLLPHEEGKKCKIVSQIVSQMKNYEVFVEGDKENCVIRFSTDGMFASGRSIILPSYNEGLIKPFAAALHNQISCYIPVEFEQEKCAILRESLQAILIEGHTDSRNFSGRYNFNWLLSSMRAEAFYTAMVGADSALETAKAYGENGPNLLGIAGYASSRPAVTPRVRDDDPRDRRIEVRFITAIDRKKSAGQAQ